MKDDQLTTGGHSMKRLLIAAAAAAAVLILAACGGGDGGGTSSGAMPSSNEMTTVSVDQIAGAGRVLVDSAGRALYAADEEADRDVLCTDACLAFWIPLTVDAGTPTGSSVPGTLGVTDRPDGSRQVTHDGKRLYSFVEDEPGQVTGDGFADAFDGQRFTWHVVRIGGAPAAGDERGAGEAPFDYSPGTG
jgi:predicted lipoprotein with Yx(FWY)xxD motif